MAKDKSKPKGAMTAYSIFVQHQREETKKRSPNKVVEFGPFSKECSEKWSQLTPTSKQKFQDLASKDKERFNTEMESYSPPPGEKKSKKRMKDPNAPKRPSPAFFLFASDERPNVKAEHPDWSVGQISKELGVRWEACTNRLKYEEMAAKEKAKYEKAMATYRASQKD